MAFQSSVRNYIERMVNNKIECMEIARKFEFDYWDGDRKYGYGGYHYHSKYWNNVVIDFMNYFGLNSSSSLLDIGCAKGFMVYAMSLLGKDASGVDISEYAIGASIPQVKDKLSLINSPDEISGHYDLLMAKDVLEHVPYDILPGMLKTFRTKCSKILVAVPLGENKKFRIRQYEMDVTHIIREPEEFWLKALGDAGFKIKFFDYQMGNLKGNWTKTHPFGNAFIISE